MQFLKILLGWFILLPAAGSLTAQSDWVLKKDKDGIKVSTRESLRSKFNDVRVEMDMPGTIYQLADILMDIDKYTEWAFSTKKSVLVKRINPLKLVYYSEFNAPWPVANRDLYAIFEMHIDTVLHSMKVESNGQKDYLPENKDLVRIPYSKGVWEISTVSNKSIHLIYLLELDPGGSVPAWVLNLFATKGPFESFDNLKNKMALLNPEGDH